MFTKGEWKVLLADECYLIMVDNQTCVARTYETFYPTGEQEANANLIAAAPDMYEALKLVLDEAPWQPLGEDIKQGIRKALSKARGES